MQVFFSYKRTVAIVILFSCKVNYTCATDYMHHVCGGTAFTHVVACKRDQTSVRVQCTCLVHTCGVIHVTHMHCEVVSTVCYWYLPCT